MKSGSSLSYRKGSGRFSSSITSRSPRSRSRSISLPSSSDVSSCPLSPDAWIVLNPVPPFVGAPFDKTGRTVSRLGRSKLPRAESTLGRALSPPPNARCKLSRLGRLEGLGGRDRELLLQLPMLLFQSRKRALTDPRAEATEDREEVLAVAAAAVDVARGCACCVGLPCTESDI